MLSSQSCSIHTCPWKNKGTFTWNHYLPWLVKCSAPSKEAKVGSTDSGPSTPYLYQTETDTCWLERKEACKPLVITWSQSTNKSFKKMPTDIWVKSDLTCWEQSFQYMIVRRIQKNQAVVKKKRGSNLVWCSTKPTSLGPKGLEEWKFCFRWCLGMARKCFGLTQK